MKGKSSDRSRGSESHGSDWGICLCFFSKGEREDGKPGVGGPLEAVVVLKSSSASSEGTDPVRDVVIEAELSLLPSLVTDFSLLVSFFGPSKRILRGVLPPAAVRPPLPILPCTVFLVLPPCRFFRGKGIAVASSNAATEAGISG